MGGFSPFAATNWVIINIPGYISRCMYGSISGEGARVLPVELLRQKNTCVCNFEDNLRFYCRHRSVLGNIWRFARLGNDNMMQSPFVVIL